MIETTKKLGYYRSGGVRGCLRCNPVISSLKIFKLDCIVLDLFLEVQYAQDLLY